MAGTVKALTDVFVPGNDWRVIVEWTGDSSYAEGGEAFTLQEAGFGPEAVFKYANTLYVKQLSEQATYRADEAFYDGSKVKFIDSATGKELAKEKDLSKVVVGLEIVCSSR